MQTLLMYRGNNGQHVHVAIIPAEVANIAAILPEIQAHFLKDIKQMWGGRESNPTSTWMLSDMEIKAIFPEVQFMSGSRVRIKYAHRLRNPNERNYYIELLPNLALLEV